MGEAPWNVEALRIALLLVTQGHRVVLGAPRGTGKTQVAIALAVSRVVCGHVLVLTNRPREWAEAVASPRSAGRLVVVRIEATGDADVRRHWDSHAFATVVVDTGVRRPIKFDSAVPVFMTAEHPSRAGLLVAPRLGVDGPERLVPLDGLPMRTAPSA